MSDFGNTEHADTRKIGPGSFLFAIVFRPRVAFDHGGAGQTPDQTRESTDDNGTLPTVFHEIKPVKRFAPEIVSVQMRIDRGESQGLLEDILAIAESAEVGKFSPLKGASVGQVKAPCRPPQRRMRQTSAMRSHDQRPVETNDDALDTVRSRVG